MRFSVKSCLLLLTWAALFCGTYVSGQPLLLLATLAGWLALLRRLSLRLVQQSPPSAFIAAFVACGWAGTFHTVFSALPISGLPVWRGILLDLTDAEGWFATSGVAIIFVACLWQVIVVACYVGVMAQVLLLLHKRTISRRK